MDALIGFWSHALAAAPVRRADALAPGRCRAAAGAAPARRRLRADRLLGMAAAVAPGGSRSSALPKPHATSSGSACSTAFSGAARNASTASGWSMARSPRSSACSSSATTLQLLSPERALAQTGLVLRITTAAGALVLVHNVYGQAAPASRSHIRFAMLGLALIWIYDLNLYTVLYLGSASARGSSNGAALVVALTAPLFALATRERERLAHPPVARGDLPVALAAGDLRLFRADGDRRHRASRVGRRLVGGADGRRARGDDRRRDGPAPERPRARLDQGQARQASVRAPLRLSHRMAALHRNARARRTRRAAARASASSRRSPTSSMRRADCCWSTTAAAALRSRANWNWPGASPSADRARRSGAVLERARRRAAASSSSKRCATAGRARSDKALPVPQWLLDDQPRLGRRPAAPSAAAGRLRHPRRARIPPPARLGGFRPAPHGGQPGGELARRSAWARKRSPTPSGSRSSTAASPSSFTTSRIWSASSRWSRAMPSAMPTIRSSAPTWWRRCNPRSAR